MTIDNNYMYACAYKVDEFVRKFVMVQLLRKKFSQLADMDCNENQSYICDRIWENPPKRGKQFFSVSPGKALRVDFFRKNFYGRNG